MAMSMPEIGKNLEKLHLKGMIATLETRIVQANQGGAAFLDVLACLLQDEIDYRESRLIERRYKASGLDEMKHLSEFDWNFNPRLPKNEIFELVTCKFIQKGEDALLIGSPGTGKSHIAKAVAHAAVHAYHRTVYREAHIFFEDIFEAEQIGKQKKKLKHFFDADLLVIDDLFLKKVPEDAADYLLDNILTRYSKRKSTLITSNRPVEDWGKLLKDNAAASAILDRLMHHGHILKFEGNSYRLKEAAKRLASEVKNK